MIRKFFYIFMFLVFSCVNVFGFTIQSEPDVYGNPDMGSHFQGYDDNGNFIQGKSSPEVYGEPNMGNHIEGTIIMPNGEEQQFSGKSEPNVYNNPNMGRHYEFHYDK